jgi:polysaccharide biosynthesis protein PslG
MTNTLTSSKIARRLLLAGVILVVFAVLLWLDLANKGLAWQTFWSLTGEEEPVSQIRGMVELGGNLIRPMPRTDPYVPINHTHENPYGINVFLEQEVEVAKRDRQLQMIAEAGFGWIRQEFPWEDIEIAGRGDFTDARNDVNGDGQIDAISAWEKYDHIVDVAEQYGLKMQVRLSNPPTWAQANPEDPNNNFAPPVDYQDFVNYAVAVAERYKGRIHHYQIWNEPNIFPEWGSADINPEAFTDLLCRTYDALKAVDPEIVVISPALAPTVALTGQNLNDYIFFQRMYDAGAGDCFDIASAQGYGFYSGPTDRRMRPMYLTFAHHLYIRDIMVANGDSHKPIWISEAAWNPVDEPDVPLDIIGRANFGEVTQEQAARYMPLGYGRAQEEWPWIGVINYWFFKRAADYEKNQAFYYFRMVEPDFTPLPIYDSMKTYIAEQTPTLYPGVHQAEDWGITIQNPREMMMEGAQFGDAIWSEGLETRVYGTDVVMRFHLGPQLALRNSGTLPPPDENGWHQTSSALSLTAAAHDFQLGDAAYPLIIDSITVYDRTWENLFPLVGSVVVALGMVAFVILSALQERRK